MTVKVVLLRCSNNRILYAIIPEKPVQIDLLQNIFKTERHKILQCNTFLMHHAAHCNILQENKKFLHWYVNETNKKTVDNILCCQYLVFVKPDSTLTMKRYTVPIKPSLCARLGNTIMTRLNCGAQMHSKPQVISQTYKFTQDLHHPLVSSKQKSLNVLQFHVHTNA